MAVPLLVGVSWQYARHPARGTVSGGGPPPHFNNLRDNLGMERPVSLVVG